MMGELEVELPVTGYKLKVGRWSCAEGIPFWGSCGAY